jgi:hypothetical protein
VATETLPQIDISRQAMVIRHYGAPFLIPRDPKHANGLPDLIGYVFQAGETPIFGLQEAADHLASNFPTFGPLSITRPCDFHSVLWLMDVAEMRRVGVASLSAHVLSRKCPCCAGQGEQLTLFSQGEAHGR